MAFVTLLLIITMLTLCFAQTDKCGTCQNSCGEHNFYCGCDSLCKIYNDCCADFEAQCFTEKFVADANLYRFRAISPDKITECKSVDFGTGYRNVPLVTQCPHDDHACDLDPDLDRPRNVSGIVNFVPVTELETGLNFVNARCAECNGVESATVWDTKLMCDDHVYAEFGIHDSSSNSSQVKPDTLQKLLVHTDCKLTIRVPIQARRPCDPDLVDTCTDGSRWSEKECRFGSTDFVNDGFRNYKNRLCATCNNIEVPLDCGLNTLVFQFAPVISPKFSLSLLLDYSSNGLIITSGKCETGFVKVAHECLPILCPEDTELEGNECVAIPKLDVTIEYHVTLNPDGKSDRIKDALQDPEFLYSSIKSFLLDRYDRISNLTLFFNISGIVTTYSADGISLLIPGEILYTVYYVTMDDPEAKPSLLELAHVLNQTLRRHLSEEVGTINGLQVEMRPLEEGDIIAWEPVKLACTQIQFSYDQFELQNGSIRILSTGQDVELKHVTFGKNGTVAVCENVLIRKPGESSSYLGITTIVVLLISLLCLLIRIVLQFFITAFHTAPMKTQFCLSLALFIGFLAFLINPFLKEGTVPCQVLGICIQWVFLLAFCIMMTIAFDMWWIFRPSGGFMKLNEGDGFFWRYLIVALLCASVVTSISIIFEYVPASEHFKPRYGELLCFFNNRNALLIFFVIPLIGAIVINLIFFTITCINLHRALSSMQKFQRQKWQHEVCLYIRLFSLMGITWAFGIAAPLKPDYDILWYLFVICNGLQGFYIFIAYVCTKKVRNELRRLCGDKPRKQSVQSTRSESLTSRGSKRAKYLGSNSQSTTSEGNRTVDTSIGEGTLSRPAPATNGKHTGIEVTVGRSDSDTKNGSNTYKTDGTDGNNAAFDAVDGQSRPTSGIYLTNGAKKLPTETSV